MKILLIIIFFFITGYCSSQTDPFWIPLNYPYGGQVDDLARDSNDFLYASGENGIFRSTDQGNNWIQVCKGFIFHLAITSDNVIYATYSDYNRSSDSRYLIRSVDHGNTFDSLYNMWDWVPEIRPDSSSVGLKRITGLFIDKNNRIYISISYESYYEVWPNPEIRWDITKILFTDDSGNSWNVCSEYDTGDKGDSLSIYLISAYKNGIISALREKTDASGNSIEFFSLSSDSGKSWNDHLLSDFNIRFVIRDVYFLNDKKLFLLTDRSLNYTDDFGTTWTKINLPNENPFCLLIEDENTFYLSSGYGVYYTKDKGATWYLHYNQMVNYTGLNKVLLKDKSGYIYANNWHGIWRSDDSCKTFQTMVNGYINLSGSWSRDFAFDKNGNVYFGTVDISKSSDNGINWEIVNIENIHFNKIYFLSNGTILAVKNLDSLFIYGSTDDGKTWEFWSKLDYNFDVKGIVENHDFLFSIPTRGYVRRSKDNGKTWEFLDNSTSAGAIAKNSNNDIFIASSYEILKTSDNGDNWKSIFNVITWNRDSLGNCMWVIPDMYFGIFHPYKPVGYFIHETCTYKTTDNGDTWNIVRWADTTPGPNDYYLKPLDRYYQMAIDSSGNMWGGFWRSSDYGERWYKINSGIDPIYHEVQAISVSPKGYIYLAMRYGGLYRSRDRYVSVPGDPSPPSPVPRLSASPNPFSDETSITYTLDAPGEVTISLYDMLGRQVAGIFNGWQDEGRHSVQLLITNYELPMNPGMYFIRLETQKEVLVSKILILR